MITIDFETEAIDGNPLLHPPKPVGVAIAAEGEQPFYTTDLAKLEPYWNSGKQLLFHNAPFDIEVAVRHLGLRRPHWETVQDTMYALFLADPYARTLSLKPSAERYLSLPPEEQDDLTNWILTNVPQATKKNAGAFISLAPEELVAPYAIGDVVRTRELYDYLMPNTPQDPYDRERRLSPILVEGTQRGIRIDRARLEEDIDMYEKAVLSCRDQLVQRLECSDGINLDSNQEFADALDSAGVVKEWRYTPTGKRSVSKTNLIEVIEDREVLDLFMYYSSLGTCLGTFMLPWFSASEADGRVHPSWNHVRNTENHATAGTRTGRLSSSSPNFQNVPNTFGQAIPHGLPSLPQMRLYCLPEEGHVWLKRDFSSQEVRILAHFEDGALMQQYQKDPLFDPHDMARGFIKDATSIDYPRKDVKITAFSIIYGSGVRGLSQQLHRPANEATHLKEAYLRAVPGVKKLTRGCSARGQAGDYITTWGGRRYYTEPSKVVNGRKMDFSYKLLNYLIQGSAADQTKQCLNDWYENYRGTGVYLATVHDEINISAPIDDAAQEMERLRDAMEQDLFDVPMKSEGFMGNNWQEIEETD